MADDVVNTFSDALFDLYNRLDVPGKKGSQDGWPFYQTEAGLRIFQEAAEPYISGKTQSATSASSPSPPSSPQSRPAWLQSFWPVGVGAFVVICCVFALVWQTHRQALANARLQQQDTEIARLWREAEQQLMQNLLAEVRVLNSNQAAFATSQTQIGVGLAKLSIIDTQLTALVSTQADASRELAAAQAALAQQTTNLETSLRQTFQQRLAETASQSRGDTEKLQTQVADLVASLRQTYQQGLAEAASQSRSDTEKLQIKVGDLVESLRQSFQQRLAKAASQSRADTEKLQTQVADLEASLPQTFQQGLAEAASQSRADTEKLQAQVADLVASLRQTSQQGLAEAASQSRADTEKLHSQVKDLVESLRQTFEQKLAKAASQSHADTVKLQTQVAELVASLRQTLKQGLAEAASQSRADTVKLQTDFAELVAGQRALLDRLSGPTNVLKLALALPGVRTKTLGNSILLTFDDGLFLHGIYFKPGAKSRLRVVAKALAQVSPHLRIEVIGCADDDCALKSWTARFEESLTLDRAAAVVNYFIELGLFAPNHLAALGSVGTSRPFPSDTVQNRANNRTVVLKVSRDEKPVEGYNEPAP